MGINYSKVTLYKSGPSLCALQNGSKLLHLEYWMCLPGLICYVYQQIFAKI